MLKSTRLSDNKIVELSLHTKLSLISIHNAFHHSSKKNICWPHEVTNCILCRGGGLTYVYYLTETTWKKKE